MQPPRTTSSLARKIITELNKADLERIEYSYLLEQIGNLIHGTPLHGFTTKTGQVLFRGVIYENKPTNVCYLGHPPADKVTSYQRCNEPHKPMFYCSCYIGTALAELDCEIGNKVYVSRWIQKKDFFIFRIPPETNHEFLDDPVYVALSTFFESQFTRKIGDVMSNQYKLTSAISNLLCSRPLLTEEGNAFAIPLGAVAFPSIAHSSRSTNLAIRPEVVDTCLSLDSVWEFEITDRNHDDFVVTCLDYSNNFDEGRINWCIGIHGTNKFTIENHEWIGRRFNEDILNPASAVAKDQKS